MTRRRYRLSSHAPSAPSAIIATAAQITVAMPTYNGARHLAEALRSIRAQTDVAFDWVACDDRSDYATSEILRAEAELGGFERN